MAASRDEWRHEEDEFGTCRTIGGVLLVVPLPRPSGSILMHVLELLENGRRAHGSDRDIHAVVDLSRARFEPTTAEIRSGVTRLGDSAEGGRIALVVGSDFQFGLGRMFGALSEDSGFDVRPFRSRADAMLWVVS